MLVDGPHFQATNGGELVFLHSDGDSSRRPSEHDILELEEESGTALRNYYLHLPLEHPDSDRWRAEIAKYLAPLVLGSKYNLLTPYHNAPISLRASLTAHFRTPLPHSLRPRLPRATPLMQSFTIHMIMSHNTYDSHDRPPTLDARRLPTRIRPTFALSARQEEPVFQTPSRLLPLRCASSPSPFRGRSRMYTYMA